MNYSELEIALDLHQKAFAFLLEARANGRATSRPLDEATIEAWRRPESCAAWVTKHHSELPMAFRPDPEQARPFAFFLSSFFATSFSAERVQRWDGSELRIRALPTRRLDGRKKSDQSRARERQAAEALCQMAYAALAEECGATLDSAELSKNLRADLALWTYAEQLVNRAQYASQGPALYHLWQTLSEEIRRNLSADLVWQARQRLVESIQST